MHATQCNSKLYHLQFSIPVSPLILTPHLIFLFTPFLSFFLSSHQSFSSLPFLKSKNNDGGKKAMSVTYLSQVTPNSESKFPFINNIYKFSVSQFVHKCIDLLWELLWKSIARQVHIKASNTVMEQGMDLPMGYDVYPKRNKGSQNKYHLAVNIFHIHCWERWGWDLLRNRKQTDSLKAEN